jgi:hypothetical protein
MSRLLSSAMMDRIFSVFPSPADLPLQNRFAPSLIDVRGVRSSCDMSA